MLSLFFVVASLTTGVSDSSTKPGPAVDTSSISVFTCDQDGHGEGDHTILKFIKQDSGKYDAYLSITPGVWTMVKHKIENEKIASNFECHRATNEVRLFACWLAHDKDFYDGMLTAKEIHERTAEGFDAKGEVDVSDDKLIEIRVESMELVDEKFKDIAVRSDDIFTKVKRGRATFTFQPKYCGWQ